MFRLADRLTVELEKKIRMSGFQDLGCQHLMAGRACGRTDVETAKIAHAGPDAGIVSPIFTSVASQPAAGGSVAALAGNPFIRVRGRGESSRRYRLKRRMADGAAGAGPCRRRAALRRDAEAFGDAFRTRVEQNRVSLGVIILLAPREILTAFFPGAAMAARRFAADRANEDTAAFPDLEWFFRVEKRRRRQNESAESSRS